MSRSEVEAIVKQVKRLSSEEQRLVAKRIAEMLTQSGHVGDKLSYSEMFGAGRGSFATPEEADAFLRRERNAWEN